MTNPRIEMIATVLDRLHQGHVPDHTSTIVIVSQLSQLLLWRNALAEVNKQYRRQRSQLLHKVFMTSIRELREKIENGFLENQESLIFVVDDTTKGVDRETALQLLQKLDPKKGHRAFMCREALPGFENMVVDQPQIH
jgi:hypothetical protein